jgi:hypothetical protein
MVRPCDLPLTRCKQWASAGARGYGTVMVIVGRGSEDVDVPLESTVDGDWLGVGDGGWPPDVEEGVTDGVGVAVGVAVGVVAGGVVAGGVVAGGVVAGGVVAGGVVGGGVMTGGVVAGGVGVTGGVDGLAGGVVDPTNASGPASGARAGGADVGCDSSVAEVEVSSPAGDPVSPGTSLAASRFERSLSREATSEVRSGAAGAGRSLVFTTSPTPVPATRTAAATRMAARRTGSSRRCEIGSGTGAPSRLSWPGCAIGASRWAGEPHTFPWNRPFSQGGSGSS